MAKKRKIMKPTYTYIASPYSHEKPEIVQARHAITMAYTAHLLSLRKIVFSPIVHCHGPAEFAKISGKFSFWQKFNFTMLGQASKLIVLELPGWKESKGVAEEMAFAQGQGIPINKHSWEEIYDAVLRYPNMSGYCREVVYDVRNRVVDLHTKNQKHIESSMSDLNLDDKTGTN